MSSTFWPGSDSAVSIAAGFFFDPAALDFGTLSADFLARDFAGGPAASTAGRFPAFLLPTPAAGDGAGLPRRDAGAEDRAGLERRERDTEAGLERRERDTEEEGLTSGRLAPRLPGVSTDRVVPRARPRATPGRPAD